MRGLGSVAAGVIVALLAAVAGLVLVVCLLGLWRTAGWVWGL